QAANGELLGAGGAAAELSTTLVVALVSVEETTAHVALARVGDSTAFILGAGGWYELFPGPADGEVLGPLSGALPLVDGVGRAATETASARLAPGSAIALMTDGIANPLRDGPGTVAPALAEVLGGGPSGELTPLDLARAADFSRRGCQDDRTVLVAWPLPD